MTLCPVAIAVGCKKCPVFKVCPVKGAIGDYKPPAKTPPKAATKTAAKKKK
jgi:hypothetical protein